MTNSDALMSGVSDLIAAKLGLNFPARRWKDLERALQPLVKEMGCDSFDALAQWMVSSPLTPAQLEQIASKLTVGETYFFREPQSFAAVRDFVVPQIVAARRGRVPPQIRVWSAGCCTGEEAYSLAIFLGRDCPELIGWRISIIGTDINPHYLQKARAGIYRGWSFRNAPPWLKSAYFSELGNDRFELCDAIKRRVTFEHLNLADDVLPSLHTGTHGIDLIFCRNVLMYFSPDPVRRAIDGFHRSLVENGCLVVGVCETSPALAPGFSSRSLPGVTIYQKITRTESAGTTRSMGKAEAALPVEDSPWLTPMDVTQPKLPPEASPAGSYSPLAHAQTLIDSGDLAGAVTSLERALVQTPLNVDVATLLARTYASQRDLPKALRSIDRAIGADRLRAPLHYLRGTILQESGELEPAAASFEKALYLDPDFVLAHIAAAELDRAASRSEKSRRHLAHALRVLRRRGRDEVLADAEGLTVGRLIAIIQAMHPAELTL
jgi:chemotaxis protein methyltransferase CheR